MRISKLLSVTQIVDITGDQYTFLKTLTDGRPHLPSDNFCLAEYSSSKAEVVVGSAVLMVQNMSKSDELFKVWTSVLIH